MKTLIPEGWGVEREDRSVGIFGDYVWHDACRADGAEPAEPVLNEVFLGYVGTGWNRAQRVLHLWTCRDCHETAAFVMDEYDPDDETEPTDYQLRDAPV